MSVLRVYDPAECDGRGVPLDWERCRTCEGEGRGLWRWPRPHEVARAGGKIMDPLSRLRTEAERRAAKTCPTCGGHGSLKAAALVLLSTLNLARASVADEADYPKLAEFLLAHPPQGGSAEAAGAVEAARCEGCGHPMSDGTWTEGRRVTEEGIARLLAAGNEGMIHPSCAVHWSPCDERCRHGGPGRRMPDDRLGWVEGGPGLKPEVLGEIIAAGVPFEASWRAVDVRVGMLARAAGLDHVGGPSHVVRPFDLRPENIAVLCLRCRAAPLGQNNSPTEEGR